MSHLQWKLSNISRCNPIFSQKSPISTEKRPIYIRVQGFSSEQMEWDEKGGLKLSNYHPG